MNFNRKLITLAATVALSAGAALAQPQAQAQGAKSERAERRMLNRHPGRIAEALNLTDAQKEQAKAIREKHRGANQSVRTELRQLGEQIRAARQANNTTEAQRLAALREPVLARARQAWQAERAELKSVLTAEQQTKLDELRKTHQGKRQHRRAA